MHVYERRRAADRREKRAVAMGSGLKVRKDPPPNTHTHTCRAWERNPVGLHAFNPARLIWENGLGEADTCNAKPGRMPESRALGTRTLDVAQGCNAEHKRLLVKE